MVEDFKLYGTVYKLYKNNESFASLIYKLTGDDYIHVLIDIGRKKIEIYKTEFDFVEDLEDEDGKHFNALPTEMNKLFDAIFEMNHYDIVWEDIR
jgi:hypothetical protein